MYLTIVLKLVFGYFGLLIVTRLIGKKEMAQVTPFDFVFAVVFGGIVEQAVFSKGISIFHMLFAILLWGGLEFMTEKASEKFGWLRGPLKGRTSILIKDGEIDIKEMEKNSMEMEQLRTMLRQQGVFSLEEIKYVFLETSGQISVMRKPAFEPFTPELLKMEAPEKTPSILLIDEGEAEGEGLKEIGRDKQWLITELKKKGVEKIEDVYYAEWSAQDGLFIKRYNASHTN